MDIVTAAILGIVQGLTEFLPVSSSGHLVLAQKILGFSEPPLLMDTMLHLGTLVAVFVVLWKDIWELLKKPFQRLTSLLLAATIPTVIIALVFKKTIEAAFASGATLGFEFLATAIILVVAEKLSAKRSGTGRTENDMTYPDSVIIGVLQGVSIMPAVSRSGLTIAGALARGLDRGFAARFSFLLSIPAILGAVVFQAKDLIKGSDAAGGGFSLPILVGMGVSMVVGIIAVKFMMKVIKEGSMIGFAAYVGVVGVLVLLDQYVFHMFF
ncbi:MAG: undecaprenyl-diphosphate phosphatase [Treponemataceae bacterium]